MAARAMTAGIEIALVDARGSVFDVRPETEGLPGIMMRLGRSS